MKSPFPGMDPYLQRHWGDIHKMAYENGGYGDDIDYRHDPVPPLAAEDAAWAVATTLAMLG